MAEGIRQAHVEFKVDVPRVIPAAISPPIKTPCQYKVSSEIQRKEWLTDVVKVIEHA
jgi:hypothetical protein